MENRINELEIKVAFQESQIEDMNAEIQQLRKDLRALRHELLELDTEPSGPHPGPDVNPLDQ